MSDDGITAYQCANLANMQSFASPNVYVRNSFLQAEMTALGWAVYFGGRDFDQCKEIIKWCTTQEECDPFLPMRDGFFRGKTVREIAEYYQRKDLLVLLEKMEKMFEAKNTKRSPSSSSSTRASMSRRDSRGFVGVSLPFQASSLRRNTSAGSTRMKFNSGSTAAELDPDQYSINQQAILQYLRQVGIAEDEQEEVCRTLMDSQFYSMKRLKHASKEDLAELGLNNPTIDKILSQQDAIVCEEDSTPPPVEAATYSRVAESEDVDAEAFHARLRQIQQDQAREDEENAILQAALNGTANTDDALFDSSPQETKPVAAPAPVATPLTSVAIAAIGSQWKPLPADKRFHFYVSYSWGKHQQAKHKVQYLVQLLRGEGYLVWLDHEQFGDNIEADCQAGVRDSCVFLCCLTPGYVDNVQNNRMWNATEFIAAQRSGMRILGLQLDHASALQLQGVQDTLDFSQIDSWETAVKQIYI